MLKRSSIVTSGPSKHSITPLKKPLNISSLYNRLTQALTQSNSNTAKNLKKLTKDLIAFALDYVFPTDRPPNDLERYFQSELEKDFNITPISKKKLKAALEDSAPKLPEEVTQISCNHTLKSSLLSPISSTYFRKLDSIRSLILEIAMHEGVVTLDDVKRDHPETATSLLALNKLSPSEPKTETERHCLNYRVELDTNNQPRYTSSIDCFYFAEITTFQPTATFQEIHHTQRPSRASNYIQVLETTYGCTPVTTPQKGDICVYIHVTDNHYTCKHAAIVTNVTSNDVIVRSKWGYATAIWEGSANTIPIFYGNTKLYLRPPSQAS